MESTEYPTYTEPNIFINEILLSQGASMTIRVAIEHFAIFLSSKDCLGKDEHGTKMRDGYIQKIYEIRKNIMINQEI